MCNPAHPQALAVEDVQPGVNFLCYSGGDLMAYGRFTTTAQKDEMFGWIPIVNGEEYPERSGHLADFGIVQYVGDNGPFWGPSYSIRVE